MAGEDKFRLAGLCALWGLSHSRVFMSEFADVIKPETFGSRSEQLFVRWCLDHWKKYGKIITDRAIEAYMADDPDFEALDLSARTIDRIIDSMEPIESDDRVRIYSDILELCKRRAYIHAQEEAERLIEKEGIDAAYEAMDRARRDQPRKSKVTGYQFPRDVKIVQRSRESVDAISSGLLTLDKYMDGGIALTEVAIFAGASGSGKSQWLCFEAAQAMMHGIDCVFYTLELAPKEVYTRIEASATGATIDAIKDADADGNEPELRAKRKDVAKRRRLFQSRMKRAGYSSNLVEVRDFTEEAPTLQAILDDLDALGREGVHPQLVIIDYADLIVPRGSYHSEHEGQSEVHKELSRIAKARNVAIWTASQVNREGISINKHTSPMAILGKIQGAFAKVFTATFVVWGAQTAALRENKESLFLMAKARRGGYAGKHFFVKWDYSRAYFRSAEDEEDELARDGDTTQANTYKRNSAYDDPFKNTEREDYEEDEGRGRRRN